MNDIIEKKYRIEVSKLAKKILRLMRIIDKLQKTCDKRKKQLQLDHKLKILLKSRNPDLYSEIVKELNKEESNG